MVIVVSESDADKVLKIIRQDPLGRDARIIGEVIESPKAKVILNTRICGTRIVDMLTTEQIPRIC